MLQKRSASKEKTVVEKNHFDKLTNNNHSQCPLGEKSWFRFNQDVVTDKNTFKHDSGLPREVVIELLPMYIELSSDELLSKCLYGKTEPK